MKNKYNVLIGITTYNQLDYTKLCIESINKITDVNCDVLVVDDASADGTVRWCKDNDIEVIEKKKGKGLTHSWNVIYSEYCSSVKNHYDYAVTANNDIIIPDGALSEIGDVFMNWPFSLVVPLSTIRGAGHNGRVQGAESHYQIVGDIDDPDMTQSVQNSILENKNHLKLGNNLFMADPFRMKMFNGFFFCYNSRIFKHERSDGNLFDPKYIMTGNEDEFNWSTLIPKNDYPALCKTAYVYHFKGVSTSNVFENFGDISNDTDKLFTERDKINNKEK